MNNYSISLSILVLLVFSGVLITGSLAANITPGMDGQNFSVNNSSVDSGFQQNQNLTHTGNLTVNTSGYQADDQTSGSISGNESTASSDVAEEGTRTEGSDSVQETPEISTGTEHPNEQTDVKSSTPTGDPFQGQYAIGGVSIDIGANLMEARGTDNNTSAELSLKDHTSALGYIKTIQKDFHYESKVDTPDST